MADKNLFRSMPGRRLPATDATNEAGGRAYSREPAEALAQYAVTGTFYADAVTQVESLLAACEACDPEFIAKVAVYARSRGFMKDAPALLCAVLAQRDGAQLERVFGTVIDSPRLLRNFVQIVRSGAVGRKSLGSRPRRLVRRWLEQRSDRALFTGSIGTAPSLADIVRMVHPKPTSPEREAMFGYLLDKPVKAESLPKIVRSYEAFKQGARDVIPDVPHQFLTSLDGIGPREWRQIARQAPWQTTRMNLNTFARHGVFDDPQLTELIAGRLRDREQIQRAKVFPYQLMTAFNNIRGDVPNEVREALQDALEIAVSNVPVIEGRVFVALDVSGSMQSPVTGFRKGSTTSVTCLDVAALMAAAIMRGNRSVTVLPFHDKVVAVDINRRDSVATNARKLAALPSGGTNCSAPLRLLNERRARGDLVIYVSDNESWMDSNRPWNSGTATMLEWQRFRTRSPDARMVCIDLQPYGTVQAKEREDILNVGGFSDSVFEVVRDFACGRFGAAHWIEQIEAIEI